MSVLTQQMILKQVGRYPLRNGKFIWSQKAFKKEFKVGDLITHGASIVGRITAIGDTRILYRVSYPNRVDERVGTMTDSKGWGKP